ncbi:MAG: hypothetical protein JNL98_15245 [Bryobacterales bacterium]|nr:hypothetical protein [Bryobacterales bacterium]
MLTIRRNILTALLLAWGLPMAVFGECQKQPARITCRGEGTAVDLGFGRTGSAKSTLGYLPVLVQGEPGYVRRLKVELSEVAESLPGELTLTLQSPDGRQLQIWDGAGTAQHATLTIADDAGSPPPDSGFARSGSFQPGSRAKGSPLAAHSAEADRHFAAPLGQATLESVFRGAIANGEWRLFVESRRGMPAVGAWQLVLETETEKHVAKEAPPGERMYAAPPVRRQAPLAPSLRIFGELVSPPPTVRGGLADFAVRVTNLGSGPTTAAYRVTSTLPPGLTLFRIIQPQTATAWNCSASTATRVDCTNTTVISPQGGSSPALTWQLAVAPDANSTVTLRGDLTGGGFNPGIAVFFSESLSISAEQPVIRPVNLTAAPEPFFAGGPVNISVAVINSGGLSASNISAEILAGFDFAEAPKGDGWNCSLPTSRRAVCTRSGLGSRVTSPAISGGGQIPAGGPAELLVTVNTTSSETPTAYSQALRLQLTGGPDLVIRKTLQSGAVVVGQTQIWSLVVSNVGLNTSLGGIVIEDVVSSGMEFVTPLPPACQLVSATTVNCSVNGTISVNGTASQPITTRVVRGAPKVVTNRARVSGGGDVRPSVETGGNESSVTANVGGTPDLILSLAATAQFVRGRRGQLTARVTNIGYSATSGEYFVRGVLPQGVRLLLGSGEGWVCSGQQNYSCSNSTPIAVDGQSPALAMTVELDQSINGSVTASAVAEIQGETFTDNNAASVTVPVRQGGDWTVSVQANLAIAYRTEPVTVSLRTNYSGDVLADGSSAQLQFTLPSFVAVNAVRQNGWVCTVQAAQYACVYNSLFGPGALAASNPLQLDITPAGDAPAEVTIGATVSHPDDQNASNNTGMLTLPVQTRTEPVPQLILNAHLATGILVPRRVGEQVTWSLVASTAGPGRLRSAIRVVVPAAAGLTLQSVSATAPWSCGMAGQQAECVHPEPTVASFAAPPVYVTHIIEPGAPPSRTITGTASTVSNIGVASFSQSATVTLISGPAARLEFDPVPDRSTLPGDIGTALLTLRNVGDAATSFPIDVALSAGSFPVTMLSAPTGVVCGPHPDGSAANPRTQCTFPGVLQPGQTLMLIVGVRPPSSFTGSVNLYTYASTLDARAGLLQASVTARLRFINLAPDVGVTLRQTGPAIAGGTVTVEGTLTNGGTSNTALELRFAEFPSGATLLDNSVTTARPNYLQCQRESGVFVCRANNILPGSTERFSYQLQVLDNPSRTATTGVTVITGQPDVSTGNNSATLTMNLANAGADLVLGKTATGRFVQGGSGSFTLTVTNVGSAASNGAITITDALPGGLRLAGFSGGGWNCVGGDIVTCHTNTSLPPQGSAAVTINAALPVGVFGPLTNTAKVVGGGENFEGNNSATAPFTAELPQPDLTVGVTSGQPIVRGQTGGSVVYRVRNIGVNPTTGPVTLTAGAIPGLTPTAFDAPGWTCSGTDGVVCSTSNIIAANQTVPLTVTYQAALNAPTVWSPSVQVTTADDANGINNSIAEPVTILTPVSITVPAGVVFTFNGTSWTGGFTGNLPSGSYPLSIAAAQDTAPGTRMRWVSWSNGRPMNQQLSVGAALVMLTGTFQAQYQLTMEVVGNGTVTPATGQYFDAGNVPVTATPTSLNSFAFWQGPVANPNAASTSVLLNAPARVTANFTSITRTAPNLTASFGVSAGLVALNRVTGRFTQTVTVTNNGNSQNAVAFVLDSLSPQYALVSPSGTTSAAAPAGSPYRELGPIQAGASVTFTLEFTRSATAALAYTPRILGTGAR